MVVFTVEAQISLDTWWHVCFRCFTCPQGQCGDWISVSVILLCSLKKTEIRDLQQPQYVKLLKLLRGYYEGCQLWQSRSFHILYFGSLSLDLSWISMTNLYCKLTTKVCGISFVYLCLLKYYVLCMRVSRPTHQNM